VLLAHQVRVERQRLAHAALVELAALQRVAGEIGSVRRSSIY